VDAFVKTYGFLSQLYNYDDTDIEKHFLFFKFLSRLIRDSGSAPSIDLSEVELVAYAIRKDSDAELDLNDGAALPPLTGVGGGVPHDPEMAALAEVVHKLNAMFDIDGVTDVDVRNIVIWVRDKTMENSGVVAQAAENTRDQFLESNLLKQTALQALIDSGKNAEILSEQFLESEERLGQLIAAVGALIYGKLNSPPPGAAL
jgi:type I restriction enzyme R subunit